MGAMDWNGLYRGTYGQKQLVVPTRVRWIEMRWRSLSTKGRVAPIWCVVKHRSKPPRPKRKSHPTWVLGQEILVRDAGLGGHARNKGAWIENVTNDDHTEVALCQLGLKCPKSMGIWYYIIEEIQRVKLKYLVPLVLYGSSWVLTSLRGWWSFVIPTNQGNHQTTNWACARRVSGWAKT